MSNAFAQLQNEFAALSPLQQRLERARVEREITSRLERTNATFVQQQREQELKLRAGLITESEFQNWIADNQ